MFNRIQFNPAYTVESIAPDWVFFVSEKGAGWWRDRLYQKLANLIDGDRDSDQIIDAILLELLAEQASDPNNTAFFQEALNTSIKIQYALFQMEQQGYIQLEENPLPPDLAIFCHHLNLAPTDVQPSSSSCFSNPRGRLCSIKHKW
jgi:ribosomal protein S12 methylthiotransferase accessory factor